MTHWDHIDIGTCDFATSADRYPGSKILLVEPLAHYLIPYGDAEGVTCCVSAISDRSGAAVIYHIDPTEIEKQDLPEWLKGCSAIDEMPYSLAWAESKGCFIVQTEITTMTFRDLCSAYAVTSIGHLQIDTEGHEHRILPGVIEMIENGLEIDEMTVEYDRSLHRDYKIAMENLFVRLEQIGYVKRKISELDVHFRLTKA